MNTGTHYNLLLNEDEKSPYHDQDFTSQKKHMLFVFSGVMGMCLIMAALTSPALTQPQL